MPVKQRTPSYYKPRAFQKPTDLQTAIDKYFKKPTNYRKLYDNKGLELGKIPVFSVSGLAHSLGFASRQSVYDYIKRDDNTINKDLSYIMQRAVLFIESEYESKLQEGNCAGIIFILKNMGWKDQTEVKETHEFNLGDIDVSNLTKDEMLDVMMKKTTIEQLQARKGGK